MNQLTITRALLFGYVASAFSVFLYSYTQVDLNLTLTGLNILQSLQKNFQSLGYYQRSISTGIFIGVIALLFILYICTLWTVHKKMLGRKNLWYIIGITTIILVFAYPAFSYDLFNYMFTSKTVLFYHQNPYQVIPLDFQSIEPWVSIMRWTHLPSAYTPLWILLTLPAYFFGFGITLLIMWNIKITIAIFHILAIIFIGKILREIDKDYELYGMALFALNPLVLIENMVSSHNDIVMIAFALFAMYLFTVQKKTFSFVFVCISIATKLITVFLLPTVFIGMNRWFVLLLMMMGLFFVISQREILSWYFIWIIPFIALLPRQFWLQVISIGVSIGLLLRYVPYLYFGNYDAHVSVLKDWLTIFPISFTCVLALLFVVKKYYHFQ